MADPQTTITFNSDILEDDIFKSKPGWWLKVYMYILLRVNREDSGFLRAGQGIFTRHDIYDDCGIAEDNVEPESLKHVIKYLREQRIIETFKTQTGIIVRIINYENMITKQGANISPKIHPDGANKARPNIDGKHISISPSKSPTTQTLAQNGVLGPIIAHSKHIIPEILRGLELYEQDPILCGKINAVMPSWKIAYPGVDIPVLIKKLHAWEMANPVRRKSNRIKFFQNRISSTQDNPRGPGERAIQDNKPIEPNVHKIITAFKIKKGFPKDDTSWDILNMDRYRDPAAKLLEYFGGDYKQAVHCIDQIANDMNYKDLSWGFDTILKWASDYKLKNGRKNQ